MTNNQVQGTRAKPIIAGDCAICGNPNPGHFDHVAPFGEGYHEFTPHPAQQHLDGPSECVGGLGGAVRPQALGSAVPFIKPRLLDLFCGAGGAAMGYHRAGFEVVGVDINPQPHFPFEFIQADCLALDPEFIAGFDAVHASPPCQHYSPAANFHGNRDNHPDLVGPTRNMLERSGLPYIIENVIGAPNRPDLVLCGTMFGLRIVKHRQFECNFPTYSLLPSCDHSDVYDPWHGPGRGVAKHRLAQDTPWIPMAGGASRKRGITGDVFNAIPPAYTKYIGHQLIARLAAQGTETGTDETACGLGPKGDGPVLAEHAPSDIGQNPPHNTSKQFRSVSGLEAHEGGVS